MLRDAPPPGIILVAQTSTVPCLESDYDFNSWLALLVTMATASFVPRNAVDRKDTHWYKYHWVPTDTTLKLFSGMGLSLTDARIAHASGFSCSSSVAWCSVKDLSSLSAAVGGPVWMNGQSMKPLLASSLILKMSHWTAKHFWSIHPEDLCHVSVLGTVDRSLLNCVSIFSFVYFFLLICLTCSYVWHSSQTAVVSKRPGLLSTSIPPTSIY